VMQTDEDSCLMILPTSVICNVNARMLQSE